MALDIQREDQVTIDGEVYKVEFTSPRTARRNQPVTSLSHVLITTADTERVTILATGKNGTPTMPLTNQPCSPVQPLTARNVAKYREFSIGRKFQSMIADGNTLYFLILSQAEKVPS